MATIDITNRSNYFRPKNIQSCADFIMTATNMSVWEKQGDPSRIAFGGNCDVNVTEEYMETYRKEHPTEDDAMNIFIQKMQEFLPDGEIIAVETIAHEKLRYVTGHTIIITNDYTEVNNMHYQLEQHIRKKFSRPDFTLDDEY